MNKCSIIRHNYCVPGSCDHIKMSEPPPYSEQPLPPQGQTAPAPVAQQTQPTAGKNPNFRFNRTPMSYDCHICHTKQTTQVSYKVGALAWLLVLLLCLLFIWPCCLLPLVIKDVHDVVHTCPNCNNQVGVYKRV
ncbi:LITAF domain-containing protein-like [Dysidea avara]|uniref:LITAF domain-containing protein-like n=1 Tax=Dysidea avara TaxID=196820 RepID=UPI0033262396